MESPWVWNLLWNSFENEVNTAKVLAMKYPIATLKGHNVRYVIISN